MPALGVPVRAQVDVLKPIPPGGDGEIAQELITPPVFVIPLPTAMFTAVEPAFHVTVLGENAMFGAPPVLTAMLIVVV